jgi:release factor glutamine methyltransferase
MQDVVSHFLSALRAHYPRGEADALGRMVLEDAFGITWTDVLMGKDSNFSPSRQHCLENITGRLLRDEPVQYVLGTANFCGMPFHVEPGVLIPRPETEELVGWIAADYGGLAPRILDVGTGSGCIAIALKTLLPEADVCACDISSKALDVARRNARELHAAITFQRCDALNMQPSPQPWDVVVSNPPYVRASECGQMDSNVLNYEPEEALFVPDDDALLFYRVISQYADKNLQKGGSAYFEINQSLSKETMDLLDSLGSFRTTLRNDMFGNPRMIKAVKI